MMNTRLGHNDRIQAAEWAPATDAQIGRIENTLTANQLYSGDFDRLWKILEAHRIDQRNPGDGTPMRKQTASRTIDWLTAQGYTPWSGKGDTGLPDPKAPRGPVPCPVPEGHYATPSRTGNNDFDFWTVDKPAEGKWAGWTFVSRVIGGREDTRIRGAEAKQALAAIQEYGIEQAGRVYGQQIGRCCKCNRHLTDEDSRQAGIGPDCAKRAA